MKNMFKIVALSLILVALCCVLASAATASTFVLWTAEESGSYPNVTHQLYIHGSDNSSYVVEFGHDTAKRLCSRTGVHQLISLSGILPGETIEEVATKLLPGEKYTISPATTMCTKKDKDDTDLSQVNKMLANLTKKPSVAAEGDPDKVFPRAATWNLVGVELCRKKVTMLLGTVVRKEKNVTLTFEAEHGLYRATISYNVYQNMAQCLNIGREVQGQCFREALANLCIQKYQIIYPPKEETAEMVPLTQEEMDHPGGQVSDRSPNQDILEKAADLMEHSIIR